MRKGISIFIGFCSFILLACTSQAERKNISINIPTIQQEATSIWRTINDIEFLEQQGYTVHLPENEIIQSLIRKSKNKQFGNTDFEQIYQMLEAGVYDKSQYSAAFEKVKAQEKLINGLIDELKETSKSWNWKLKTFDTYPVVFTLYGTGGSYDPDEGQVTLFTNQKGDFMRYPKPANTIIHEIVHMGIEQSIVQQYQLSHGVKERLVDTITYILFKDQLNDYVLQPMGDVKLNEYVKNKDDLKKIDSLIVQYQREHRNP